MPTGPTTSARREPNWRCASRSTSRGIVDGYTARRRPVELVFGHFFAQLTEAIAAKRQVKGWRRAKKEALIARRFDLLPELAEGYWRKR